jgi:hypothetical protein
MGLLPVAAWLAAATTASAANCCIVLGGTVEGSDQNQINRLTETARTQYLAKGYTTLKLNNCTKAQFLAALNNPCVTHIVYAGHGVATNTGFAAEVWLGAGTTAADYLSAAEVVSMIPAARRAAMQQVVLQACGQLKQEWADAFPNATIQGWTTEVPAVTARVDQNQFGSGRITPKGARGGGPLNETWTIDPRITAAMPREFQPASGRYVVRVWTDLSEFEWLMPPALASAFGNRRFNFYVGDTPADEVVVGGFEVANGDAITHSPDPFPAPDFDLRMTHAAYASAIENIDMLFPLFGSGQAFIGANTTPVPGPTLYQGAIAVTFGFGALTPPLCFGDADGSGVVDFGDVTSVLANFGAVGPPFRPGDADGSGVVDFGDITSVLANFGATC